MKICNDLLTIIVSIYNGGNFLSQCMEFLMNQDCKNIEIILMNDGSIDNSFYNISWEMLKSSYFDSCDFVLKEGSYEY